METAKNIIITRGILTELDIIPTEFAFPLLIDNTGNIAISGGEKITRNARHIDIRYHHIRDLIQNGTIEVLHIPSKSMAVDGLTKALATVKFKEFRDLIGLSKEDHETSSDGDLNDSDMSDDEAENDNAGRE